MKQSKTPWAVPTYDNEMVLDADNQIVAFMSRTYRTREEIAANSRLCALAPEMLDALEGLIDALANFDTSDMPERLKIALGNAESVADKVIKKAKSDD
jgi:hypothetical protein